MPFCRKCGEKISDHQFEKFNKTCKICINLYNIDLTQDKAAQKVKTKKEDIRFLKVLGLVLLGITVLGTTVAMGVHYWFIKTYLDSQLSFGAFFLDNFVLDVIIGFFVGIVIVVVIVILFMVNS